MNWHFSRKRPSDKTRDPIASEFFASDAIKDPGEALVREGIQNSLDARLNTGGACRIRIYISAEHGAIEAQNHTRWFESAWPHYMSEKNGLKPGSIASDKPCKYLVFEDFETTGLTGDTEQHVPIDGEKNAFFYFFRAEGKTEKGGDDRGRWGIGKQVFPRSSNAQTFFGYSETANGPALMGGCILKHHKVNGVTEVCYKPDGYFGLQKIVDDDDLTIPIRDPEIIKQFKKDFNISRNPGDSGLSIVVPWLDDGDEEDRGKQGFSRNSLSIAAISGYFIPILEGRLEVLVEDHIGSHRIDQSSYKDILDQIEASGDERIKRDVRKLRSYIEVAESEHADLLKDYVLPPCSPIKAEWSQEMLSEAQAQDMREALAAGTTIRVRSTLTVRPKNGNDTQDNFVCLVRKLEGFSEKPCHIREDLIIPDVARSPIHGFVCLVRVNRGALATLLGDSENPSHTEWQKDSKNFKGKYTYGGIAIEYVSSFAHELVKRIHATSRQLDRKLLMDIFHDEQPEAVTQKPKPKPGTKPIIIKPPVQPTHQLSITERRDGFSLSSVGAPFVSGARLLVSVAYETSKGNPFRAYKKYDFDLGQDVIVARASGCEISNKEGNRMVITVRDPDFALNVTGFDTNRDLVVKAKPEATNLAAPNGDDGGGD